ncbi:response regulator transcription factor [Actinoallomurus sp. NPDC050550]|uniref:response regulator transcription factor n=1 Tax=Actinoallomurus sp. NPDC050550 TaxID=3154937 RepID=UPI0033F15662
MSEPTVRVIVADDQATVREGLVALLELLPGVEVVAQAEDGHAVLAAVAAHRPDVVLMDLRMPGMDGTEATRRIVADHPEVAVVVLTSYADDESVLTALAAGARGFLTKNAGHREIRQAVTAAAAGLAPVDPAVQARLVATARVGRVPERTRLPDGLTVREAEVLTLISVGLSNGQIAARLHIETVTVKSHINRAFAKAGITGRAEVSDYTARHGLTG